LEARIARQRGGGEVEQPGGDDAATAPHLGDVGEVEVVLVVDRVAEWSRLGIRGARPLPHVRVAENVEPLGVGRHEAVLDAVMDHLHEVAGAVRATVQVTLLRRPAPLLATGGARHVPRAGRQRREERVEMTHDVRLAADHEAVAALETEHAAARAAVHVVGPAAGEPGRAVDVVTVEGVPAVDDDVAALEAWDERLGRRVDAARRYHEPDDPWLRELLDEGVQRRRAARTLTHERLHGGCRYVVHHAGVPAADETTHHVRSHATQPDHADLHCCLLSSVPAARPCSTSRVWRATIRSSFVLTTRTTHAVPGGLTIGAPASFACGSSATPRCSSPRQISRRITAECSPMPPVKTRLSIPPRTAASAPTSRRARWQNIATASAASGLRSRAARSVRTSALSPETPRSPDLRSISVVSSPTSYRPVASRCSRTPGSRSPGRVPIMRPPVGVSPIVVSTARPSRTAAMLAPLPRCPMTRRPRRAGQRAAVDHAMSDGIRCGKLMRVERGKGRLARRPAVGNVDGALDRGGGPFSQGEASAGVADPLDCAGRERHLTLPELVES